MNDNELLGMATNSYERHLNIMRYVNTPRSDWIEAYRQGFSAGNKTTENEDLKALLSEEIIENALINYIESFSFSMLPQDQDYLKSVEVLKNKAKDTLRKIKELKK